MPARVRPTPTTKLSLTGHGSVTLVPDVANIAIGVEVFDPDLSAAHKESSQRMAAVIAAIERNGVGRRDIATSVFGVRIRQERDKEHNPIGIAGYDVSNRLTVCVRDTAVLGSIFEAVIAAGANTIHGVSFDVAEPVDSEDEARALAVQDALRKARVIADAANLEIVRIAEMSAHGRSAPLIELGMSPYARETAPVEAGSTDIEVSIHVTFELRPKG